MASSRFPGKPLLNFYGLPMVEHVRRRAVKSGAFSDVVVATCDREIEDVVKLAGGKVIMTASTHVAATERLLQDVTGGVRVVFVAEDGAIYFCTAHELARITPAG